MPRKPLKPCKHPGCPELTAGDYCEKHIKLHQRPSAKARGYDYKWQKASKKFLKAHPFCEYCKKESRLVKATVVDHITPHRGEQKLFWDESNWQALCKKCHDQKTMTEDRYEEYKYFF